MLAKEAGMAEEDAFALLGHYGAESAGSLVLVDPVTKKPVERGLRPLALAELSQRISDLPRASLTKDAPKRMSLAGAQHKMLIVVQDNQLFEPLPGTPSTHILKPSHQGEAYPASVMNEYFTMRLARKVGLDVPAVRRIYVPQPVYLVERFDRIQAKNGGEIQRLHVIDTCQLLNKARTFKYSAAKVETLLQAAILCRGRAAARLYLYRWVLFNSLVGNGDNHLKNISFIVDASGIKLAPAYDLLATAVYDTRAMADERAHWPHVQLALHLGDAQTFGELTRSHIIGAGRTLGLAESTAVRELDRMSKVIVEEADKLIAEIMADIEADVSASPDPEAARLNIAGEIRLINAVRHIVLPEMVSQLGPR